jgi:hypothetical protein
MVEGESHSIMNRAHLTLLIERQSLTELRVICSSRSNLPTMWSHLDLSEPTMKDLNRCIKVGDHKT